MNVFLLVWRYAVPSNFKSLTCFFVVFHSPVSTDLPRIHLKFNIFRYGATQFTSLVKIFLSTSNFLCTQPGLVQEELDHIEPHLHNFFVAAVETLDSAVESMVVALGKFVEVAAGCWRLRGLSF